MRKFLFYSVAILAALSGTASSQGREFYSTRENGVDRPGSDIRSFGLPGGSYPDLCAAACRAESGCVAWTYVEPGFQGPNPRCWLKSAVPPPVAAGCCTSGVMK